MLMKKFPNEQFGFSVSHTTRKPREGEEDGVHYNFSTVEKVKAEIDEGKFIEYAEVHGNYYGTSVDAVESVRSSGKVCVLDIDYQGVINVKKSNLSPYYIFVSPPSMEELEKRLRSRGTESEEDIVKRLGNAAKEMEYGNEEGNFDLVLVNNDLSTAFGELCDFFNAKYDHLKAQEEERESPAANPCPVIFCGPSGVGKGTLIDMLMKKFPNEQFGFSVSHTTRKPREGEEDGVHYNFSTVEKVKAEIDEGKFIEYAEVHGNYYGTSVDAVESVRSSGKVCVLDIDYQGVINVKKSNLSPYYIFVSPPSMEELEKRLRSRGTESEEDIVKRLGNAAKEMEYGNEEGNFDLVLVNNDLSTAFGELCDFFNAKYDHLKAQEEERESPAAETTEAEDIIEMDVYESDSICNRYKCVIS